MRIVALPVSASAIFGEHGDPRPYKFKYCDIEGIQRQIKVDVVLSQERTNKVGQLAITYYCQSMVYGELKLYELRYYIAECKWVLYRI